jgi:serine/threonine-protein kinase
MTEEVALGFLAALSTRYRVEDECGRGGTSVVYRARDVTDERLVAVKVMRPELSSATGGERFLREVRIAQALQHPRIAALLDFGELNGVLYCVFPFIEGETLRRRLAREGALPVDDALRLTREVGEALAYAHQRGVIHRDVKPENILLSDGHAVLSDFGIARAIVVAAGDRVTDSGVAVGTPAYMSPEQATAEAVLDERTDQYALAVCLYEMLAGSPPFVGRTSQAIIARQVAEPPPPLEIVRPTAELGVVAAIERALAKLPADRFDSIDAFLRALDARDTRPRRGAPPRRWHAVISTAALLGAAALWLLLRPPALDPSRVLVFPARTIGTGVPAGTGLRIADAIQVAVEHTEPLRWIPAWENLDAAVRADPGRLQADEARNLARRRGARYYVLSALEVSGPRTQVVIWLHDAAGDSVLTQVSASDSTGTLPATALAIGALPRLLAKMLDPTARVDLSPLTDRRLPAIVKLFEGEEAYRTARFAAAFGFYRAAVAEDSMFAYAALKGAQAASWLNQLEDAIDLVHRARATAPLLPPKYRPYLRGIEAYLDGRADSAVAGFQGALAADRYWAEAATALGEVYYHLLPNATALDSLAEASFARAIAIDSLFVPPLFHLAEISLRRRESAQGARYIDRMRRVGADVARTRHLAVMARCADGSMAPADWEALARVSANDAMLAAREVAAAGRLPACAVDGMRVVLRDPDAPAGVVWAAVLGLHGSLVALGRTADAVRLLDSASTSISTKALAFALIDVYADSAFQPLAAQAEAFGREKFGPNYETAKPRSAWAFGVWEAWKHNGPTLEAVAARLADLAQQSGAPVHALAAASLAAHVALVRGDTTEAIRRFTPMPPVAPRDSLAWEFLEPMAADRMTLAQLLLARGRAREALDVLSIFDHPAPVAYFAFVRRSLELRVRAATLLGRSSVAAELRERLRALGAAAPSRS